MKLNKSKNKGKVHPSPSSSSSASSYNDVSSLNHLLPTAILTLISVLSLQDREALAYMITHSLKSSTLNHSYPSSSASLDPKTKKKSNKKPTTSTTTNSHSSPSFDCCCFDCFSHFWNRWDSSPHSELIHQAIEAFEEHLSSSEKTKSKKKDGSNSSKRRAKTASLFADVEERESCVVVPLDVGDGGKNEEVKEEVGSPEILFLGGDDVAERESEDFPVADAGEDEEKESGAQELQQQQQHKGLARKVLPDVIGLFHSRLWKNLWGPNV